METTSYTQEEYLHALKLMLKSLEDRVMPLNWGLCNYAYRSLSRNQFDIFDKYWEIYSRLETTKLCDTTGNYDIELDPSRNYCYGWRIGERAPRLLWVKEHIELLKQKIKDRNDTENKFF